MPFFCHHFLPVCSFRYQQQRYMKTGINNTHYFIWKSCVCCFLHAVSFLWPRCGFVWIHCDTWTIWMSFKTQTHECQSSQALEYPKSSLSMSSGKQKYFFGTISKALIGSQRTNDELKWKEEEEKPMWKMYQTLTIMLNNGCVNKGNRNALHQDTTTLTFWILFRNRRKRRRQSGKNVSKCF